MRSWPAVVPQDASGESENREHARNSVGCALYLYPVAWVAPSSVDEAGAVSDAGAVLTGPEAIPRIRPGGPAELVAYDLKGNFVVSLDRGAQEIVVIHHLPNATPAHEIRGRHGAGILLGLLRENLVSQLSHAGYLGAELAKAETALRLDLDYRQDRPLRKPRQPPHSP